MSPALDYIVTLTTYVDFLLYVTKLFTKKLFTLKIKYCYTNAMLPHKFHEHNHLIKYDILLFSLTGGNAITKLVVDTG